MFDPFNILIGVGFCALLYGINSLLGNKLGRRKKEQTQSLEKMQKETKDFNLDSFKGIDTHRTRTGPFTTQK